MRFSKRKKQKCCLIVTFDEIVSPLRTKSSMIRLTYD